MLICKVFCIYFYLPEEGKVSEYRITKRKKEKKKKNIETCIIISSWNANNCLVFMCTVVVYTNKMSSIALL